MGTRRGPVGHPADDGEEGFALAGDVAAHKGLEHRGDVGPEGFTGLWVAAPGQILHLSDLLEELRLHLLVQTPEQDGAFREQRPADGHDEQDHVPGQDSYTHAGKPPVPRGDGLGRQPG